MIRSILNIISILARLPLVACSCVCSVSLSIIYRTIGVDLSEWGSLHLWYRKIPIYRLTAAGLRAENRASRTKAQIIPYSEIHLYQTKNFLITTLDECLLNSGDIVKVIRDDSNEQFCAENCLRIDYTHSPMPYHPRIRAVRKPGSGSRDKRQ